MTRHSAAVALLFLTACATTTVDMNEPRRVVGTASAVRVDAMIRGDELRAGTAVPITYDITNQRDTTIAVADVIPVTSYDPESRTITVDIGAEVPGQTTLPRLVSIAPGEKKSFTASARIAFTMPPQSADPRERIPGEIRLKVNFLGDTSGFTSLLDIPERVVADAKLADTLFPLWLERNEVVYTNPLPMRWVGRDLMPQPAPPRGTRRP